jgi:hypothetical protein
MIIYWMDEKEVDRLDPALSAGQGLQVPPLYPPLQIAGGVNLVGTKTTCFWNS